MNVKGAYDITIVTPAYNRAGCLERLYDSLIRQTNKNFAWLVIDDGSTDETKSVIQKCITRNKVRIKYYHQSNQGKHIALNNAIKKVNTKITFIVDSDDYLVENAVEHIISSWKEVEEKDLAGISYLKMNLQGEILGDMFPKNRMVDTYTNVRHNMKVKGDKAEVWATEELIHYSFPSYDKETFCAEGYLWNQISGKKKILFINDPIYISEYLPDGLSNRGRKLRLNNPLGAMDNARICLGREFCAREKLKNSWLYVSYCKFAGKGIGEIIKESGHPLLILANYIPGILLYGIWKIRFRK